MDDHHAAIIDRETFDKVQALMESRAAESAGRKQLVSPFAGLIRCGKCGCMVAGHRTPTSRANGDSRFVTWRCGNRNRRDGCDCRNSHNPELFEAAETIPVAGTLEEKLRAVETILMYDDRLVFEMRNGRKHTWRRK